MSTDGRNPFLLSVDEVIQLLETDVDRGLNSAQIPTLQEKYGPNELDVGGAIPWYTIFLRQLFNAMILVSLQTATRLSLLHIDLIMVGRFCSLPWP
jgi:P-type Na+/K+ transporter